MSCHGSNRKRIAIIAGAGAGAAGVITYVSLAANPVAAAALPVVLAFAACPAMCAAMGGIMWLNHRMSKKKNKTIKMLQQQQGEPRQTIQHQQPEEKTKDSEIQQGLHYKQRERTVVGMVPYTQKQRKKKTKQDTDTGIT